MNTCKNCSFEFEGKFCPKCGQKSKTGRITIRQVFNEARQHFIHFDQGFLYTVRELALRPGHSIREYIAGKRVKHVKPVKFMFWAAAINFLIMHFLRLDEDILKKVAEQQQNNNPKANELSQKLGGFIFEHPSILLFSMIPAIALCSWLFFRRRGYNYAEHFVVSAYLMGEISLAAVATIPVSKFLNSISTSTVPMTLFSGTIWVAYFGWAYSQLFTTGSRFWVWLKGGLTVLMGYFLLIMLMGIVMLLLVIFFKSQLTQWLGM